MHPTLGLDKSIPSVDADSDVVAAKAAHEGFERLRVFERTGSNNGPFGTCREDFLDMAVVSQAASHLDGNREGCDDLGDYFGMDWCAVEGSVEVYDMKLARAICEGVAAVDPGLILLGLSGSCLMDAAAEVGLRCAREVFADRAYEEDGSLVARGKPGAMIDSEDEAIHRVIRMVREGRVRAISGRDIDVRADSVCLHGDGAHAVAFARRISEALRGEGIAVTPLGEVAL